MTLPASAWAESVRAEAIWAARLRTTRWQPLGEVVAYPVPRAVVFDAIARLRRPATQGETDRLDSGCALTFARSAVPAASRPLCPYAALVNREDSPPRSRGQLPRPLERFCM